MDLKLTDKVIIIAGASRGIGLGIVESCLAEGAIVVLAARREEELHACRDKLAERYGCRVHARAGDFTNKTFSTELVAYAERDIGPVWGAVSNVGLHSCPSGYDIDDAVWSAGFDQNLGTAYRLARAVLPGMESRKGGVLLFVSSMATRTVGSPLTYGTAKAALNHLTAELASRVGPAGVRVNAISPGPVHFHDGEWDERLTGERTEAWQRWLRREVALGRCGTPAELGAIAAVMLSPVAAFVTGSVWSVDGGRG